MTVGSHYADETDLAAIITIPIAAGSLAAYLEATLELIDHRINFLCHLSANLTTGADFEALGSVEYNAFLKVMQNTRISREGVPAEISFKNFWFSDEDREIMTAIAVRTKRSVWIEESH